MLARANGFLPHLRPNFDASGCADPNLERVYSVIGKKMQYSSNEGRNSDGEDENEDDEEEGAAHDGKASDDDGHEGKEAWGSPAPRSQEQAQLHPTTTTSIQTPKMRFPSPKSTPRHSLQRLSKAEGRKRGCGGRARSPLE